MGGFGHPDGTAATVDHAFSALTADVIYAQFFGAHLDYLSDPDIRVPWRDACIGLAAGFHISRFIPSLLRKLKRLRPSFFKFIMRLLSGPLMNVLFELQEHTRQTVQSLLDDNNPDSPSAQCMC